MNIRQYVTQYGHTIAIVLTVVFIAYFFTLIALNHAGLRTQLPDLGHMVQAVWSVSRGDYAMTVSDPGAYLHSRLIEHANFIFYFISPFYALVPTPYTLLFIGALAVGLGGYFTYLLALRVTNNQEISLLFFAALLLNPMVQDTLLYDFHPIVLAIGLIPAALFFAHKKSWVWYWVSIVLLLSLKEDTPLLVAAMSPFIFLKISRKQGIVTLLAAVLYWVTIMHGIPALTGIKVASYNLYRLGDAGNTPEGAIVYFLTHPTAMLQLLTITKIQYLAYLAVQGGFLYIFAPLVVLFAIPSIAQNVLVDTSWQTVAVGLYYSGAIIAVTYSASIFGYTFLKKRAPRLANVLLLLFVVQAVFFTLTLSQAPYSLVASTKDYGIYYDRTAFAHIQSLIPPTASLAAQANVAPHFAQRAFITLPNVNYPTDYVLFHLADPTWSDNGLFFLHNKIILTNDNPSHFYSYLTNKDYGLIAHEGKFYLFKHGATHTDDVLVYEEAAADLKQFKAGTGNDTGMYSYIPRGDWLKNLFNKK